MAFRRHARELPDQASDQPFKNKPAPPPPTSAKLIFTEPIDRTAHLFADEGADATADASGQAVPMPDSSFVIRVRVAEEKPAINSLRLLQGAVAVVSLVVLGLLLYPTPNRPEPEPGVVAPPAAAAPAPPQVIEPAATPPSPPRTSPVPLPTYYIKRDPATGAPKPRAKDTPGATQGAGRSSDAAAGPEIRSETRPIPMLNMQRLDEGGGTPLGAPMAGPVIDGPSTVDRREREVAARPAAASATSAGTTADGAARERDVRQVLSRYQAAYSSLDADEAARLYPAIDRKALSRAFSALDSQRIQLEDCRVELRPSAARATCGGSASWKPKVGGVTRAQARRWQFDLRQVGAGWQIGNVTIQ